MVAYKTRYIGCAIYIYIIIILTNKEMDDCVSLYIHIYISVGPFCFYVGFT
jgi:hypothetical protein